MPRYSTHVVVALLSEREGLQRVSLDSGRRAYVLTGLIGPVAVGDPVVVNTTAVDLDLGTGGWDVVHWNLARAEWTAAGAGHVMKLRYTSLQTDTGAAEEHWGYTEEDVRVPVVACGLHSLVPCVAAVVKHLAPERRLVYVMTDAGALPLALSDLVVALRIAGLLDATVTAGQAFGGDHEAVNLHSALSVARGVAGADVIVAGTGIGGVGTGRGLGFSAVDVAGVVDAAGGIGAHPIVAVRYSDADPRPRHRGVSHHVRTALSLARTPALVPVPRGRPLPDLPGHEVVEVDVPDVPALLRAAGLSVTSMGRGPHDDPEFYAYAGAAGVAAAAWVSSPP
ncbi:MAG: DUF3866 family protein [Actinomycetota bacterium]|nr:DUF3866 family protein [Actinomycetota bacterium]